MNSQNRQLAAILFTDIVGYTAMMQQDENKALDVTRHYLSVLDQSVKNHHGKILNDYGDGSLCSFGSVTEAILCAVDLQQQLMAEPRVPLRIGLHSGEVFFEGNKAMGDCVNVASRIQSLGQANTILFSREIFNKIKNHPEFKSVSLGKFEFKNVDEPMEIFALANEGLTVPKREEMTGKLKEIKKRSALRKLLGAITILTVLTVTFFIYKKFTGAKGFSGEKSIAVLPFESIGIDSNEGYISDGITQDIIGSLSKISSLNKVIGWFSVRGFRNSTKTPKQIADELGVAAILRASIQWEAGKTKIFAELIEAANNNQLWGDDFEYTGKDILSIQSKVAMEIVTALEANITPDEKKNLSKRYTESVEAYKLYRKGRSFWDKRSRDSYDSAEVYYKKALELDPDYALAYAGLADCYTFNQKGLPQLNAIPIARQYAAKALSLDSSLVEALTTEAFIQSHFDFDWKGARMKFEKITRDNPNYPVAHLYYGNILLFTGERAAGIQETKKALSLDPLSSVFNFVLGRNYYCARWYDSAITQLQKTVILNSNFIPANVYVGGVFVQKKDYAKAIEAFSKLPTIPFDQGANGLLLLSYAYAMSGDKEKAKQLLESIPKDDLAQSRYMHSYALTGLGNYDEAIQKLEEGYENHVLSMIFLKVDPIHDPLRNEPRFKALIKKMNFE